MKVIGTHIVREQVFTTEFCCDLEKCKGACCTFESDYGAPVLENEVDAIGKVLQEVIPYLPEEHRLEIEKGGYSEVIEGDLLLRSFKKRACVFVYYEGSIAKCAIEKAYFDGKSNFRKPISCHLFPIRVTKFGTDVLRFQSFDPCFPALEKGRKEHVALITFLKEPLERAYGSDWYLQLIDNK